MNAYQIILVYGVLLVSIWLLYLWNKKRKEKKALESWKQSLEAGLTEPPSLHPLIDEGLCIGAGGCVSACPEGNVIAMIAGRAKVINPSNCIGHGACKDACHMNAISLVFGTEKRGVDIPEVSPDYQTNIPGLYIAGELGGMGLIRNAINQGCQAIEAISKLDGIGKKDMLDVIIVGAGPAGFAATLACKSKGLRYKTLEQESFGGTVAHYPRGKIVMTEPIKNLPLVGKVKFKEVSKEALLAFWQDVIKKTGIHFDCEEKVEDIKTKENAFEVITDKGSYQSRAVLLAIGRRGTPRKLGVPGEDKNKVVYRLIDAEQYRNQKVLVVGGGDSALEATLSIAEQAGAEVTLSCRGDAFPHAKPKNREKIAQLEAEGKVTILYQSNMRSIGEKDVVVEHQGKDVCIENDAVIVLIGGVLPTPFLKKIGVQVETKFGTA